MQKYDAILDRLRAEISREHDGTAALERTVRVLKESLPSYTWVGVYLLHDLGLVNLHVKPVLLGANVLGAAIFGVGMLLLGF